MNRIARFTRIVLASALFASAASLASAQAYTQYFDYYQILQAGTLTVDGDLAMGDDVAITGDLTVTATTTLNGTTAINGTAIGIGNATTDVATVTATVAGATPIVFEGATADAFETTIAVADPGADVTVTIPAATGTVQVSGQSAKVGANGSVFSLLQRFTGTVVSGQTVIAISATGVLGTDLAVGAIVEDTTNEVSITSVVCSTDTVTVTLGGDPGASNADVVVLVTRI